MKLPLLVDLPGRDDARELAHRELTKPAYDEAQPPLATRVVQWVFDKVAELLGRSAASVPGGRIGVALIALLVIAIITVVVVRLRPTLRDPHGGELFGAGHILTAAEHRSLADAAAAGGDFAEAVRERLRAIVRELEQRGVLDPRPGRTAAEVSTEAGRAAAELVEPLRRAATTFERIWYGGQVADASSYAVLVGVDGVVAGTRLVAR